MAEKVAQTGAPQGLGAPTPVTLSHTSTMESTDDRTLHGHGSPDGKLSDLPAASTLGKEDDLANAKGGDGFHASKTAVALSTLPAGRKSILLLCFCLAYVSPSHTTFPLADHIACSLTQRVCRRPS
jgi:hypothetical protein